ncbi:MAG TPA: 23S rRNA (guanosine(2251)-2'-O)-methyltransferase RlmB [Candidatus Galloscillospira excrementipullorum]|nr:23S rRNA (guanosine(2251)-2'-O)-methyltransferase RlmB [Candidatus Galloscillospira excrementipullorum]
MKRELGRRTDEAPEAETLREGVVAGRNAVLEAIKSAASIEKIYVARGEKQGSIVRILALAREKNIVVQEADRVKLDHISGITTHQGVVAYLGQKDYCTVDDMLEAARSRGEAPFLILCDEIADPHNLGAILRTAEVAGAHGVIVPKHRGVGITPAVTKASAGAVFHVAVAKVTNLVRTMEELKQKGVWLYGTDAAAQATIYETDFTGGVGLVIGSEGAGMSRLVRETCDFLVSIPMFGQVNSLNASVAAGVVMYEVVRQRCLK